MENKTKPPPIACVNRFVPPDSAPTAAALSRLAALLAAQAPALSCVMIGSGRAYAGGGAAGERRLADRAVASWRDGRRLADQAARYDVVLSLTDPPLLNFRLARRLAPTQRWIEWVMDAYPEALWAAAGLAPRSLPRAFGRSPDLRLYLGPRQAEFLASAEKRAPPRLILPAGARDSSPVAPPSLGDNKRVHLVYAGNLGRAHWTGALPMLAAACDPARFHLTVSTRGAATAAVRAQLARFPHVVWRDCPLTDAELDAADVHVVSLKENWTHVCVPSKAASALCRGRPILFFGAPSSDVWGWADGAGWRIDPAAAAARALSSALEEMAAPERLAMATARAQAAGNRLRQAESAAVDALAQRLTPPATA